MKQLKEILKESYDSSEIKKHITPFVIESWRQGKNKQEIARIISKLIGEILEENI